MGLLKLPGNRICVDCKCKGPRWGAFNHGVFFCIKCSAVHRGIGRHISKVKSCTLDDWRQEEVDRMEKVGNERFNFYYEAKVPPSYQKSFENDDSFRERFIRAKYEQKLFFDRAGKKGSGPEADTVQEQPISSRSSAKKSRHRSSAAEKARTATVKPTPSDVKEIKPQAKPVPTVDPLDDLLSFATGPAPSKASVPRAGPKPTPVAKPVPAMPFDDIFATSTRSKPTKPIVSSMDMFSSFGTGSSGSSSSFSTGTGFSSSGNSASFPTSSSMSSDSRGSSSMFSTGIDLSSYTGFK
ncbi:hypothetical protein ADUPG1_011004 [Aduncisulcus paluster]|uniref:Arf-GAP domain-containing protein n=1 Tax=Aduncisulcus paluster TaxID=2918883 RepID=A0ABQ5JY86_9EUKA|nr:hypothetical protein ADUPG1_011004 [Aduncisulcus paluster]